MAVFIRIGEDGGGMESTKVLILVVCVLILCVLSFSVPPTKEQIIEKNIYYKHQKNFVK
jgi:multisubunit Na+/H+ antiporter MnhB subunit